MADRSDGSGFHVRRILAAAGGIIALLLVLYFFWNVAPILLILFAGILFGIFLDAGARLIRSQVDIYQGWAVAIFALFLIILLGLAGWLTGPQIIEQGEQLGERIPEAWEEIQGMIAQYEWGQEVIRLAPDAEAVMPRLDIVGQITGVFSIALSGIVNFGLILVIGLYLAINPGLYINNVVMLVPKERRERAYEVIGGLGHALRWWLVGQIGEMVVIFILVSIGFSIIGLPMALPLGLIAGLLAFIPYLGPLLGLIPALMVAFIEGPTMVLYVLIVYFIVQNLESNVITPLIQLYAVSLPPALLIASQILLGFMAGFMGILIATPLTVAVLVLIQTLYVEDVLGDEVKLMGMSRADQTAHPGSMKTLKE